MPLRNSIFNPVHVYTLAHLTATESCSCDLAGEGSIKSGGQEALDMPPHLHPRSRLTSSLFATTLFASFFVVALPHVLPCPAPRVAYADDGTPRRRRRRKCVDQAEEGTESKEDSGEEIEERARASKRECPIPKPGGVVGDILGFKTESSTSQTAMDKSSWEGRKSKPP